MIELLPTIKLIRLEENFKFGTFGVWVICNQVFCVTLEPADLENQQNVSSIPAQQYTCEEYSSPKYPNTYQVMDVPGRSKVLIHAGNVKKHTQGCIILAQHYGKINTEVGEARAALNSGKTLDKFIQLMYGVPRFKLTVAECY